MNQGRTRRDGTGQRLHTVTDYEDNWLSGKRICGRSFDTLTGPLTSTLNFNDRDNGDNRKLILDPTTGTRAEE